MKNYFLNNSNIYNASNNNNNNNIGGNKTQENKLEKNSRQI